MTTSSIQAVLDALPDTGGEVVLPAGVHIIDCPIEIKKPNITLRGECVSGTTVLRAATSKQSHLMTVSGPHFRLYNVQIEGLGHIAIGSEAN